MKKIKIVEIGGYPPPYTGWSTRIKYLKEAFIQDGHDCQVLNLGKNRNTKSSEYIDVQNGFDYIKKLLLLKLKGYHFHLHTNAQAVKNPLLVLIAIMISLFFLERPAITFHGGLKQLYFPCYKEKKMYWIIYLNFLLSKLIICNDEEIRKEIRRYGPFIKNDKIHPIQAFSIQYMNIDEMTLPDEINQYLKQKSFSIVSYIAMREGYFIDILVELLENIHEDIGVVIIGIGSIEDKEISRWYRRLLDLEKQRNIFMLDNLEREHFLALLKRCDIYLRTYISDGVASSVLEALSLGTIVVASDNGTRPPGVITYKADNLDDLKSKIFDIIENLEEYKGNINKPCITDTISIEKKLLISSYKFF